MSKVLPRKVLLGFSWSATALGLCILLLLAASVGCRTAVLGAEEVAAWAEDIEYLRTQLPEVHADPFFVTSEEEWNEMLEDLIARLPYLHEDQVNFELMKAVTTIGDDHTFIDAFPERLSPDYSMYPVDFTNFNGDLFIQLTEEEYLPALGSRVLSINGMLPDDVLKALEQIIPHENRYVVRKAGLHYLRYPVIAKLLGVVEGETMDLRLEAASGEQFTIEVAPKARTDFGLSHYYFDDSKRQKILWLRSNEVYRYEYVSEHKLMYFQYNACYDMEDLGEGLPFAAFNESLMSDLQDLDVEKLVIDLRLNPGGNSGVLQPFIDSLSALEKMNQRGRVFVIIGNATFSSAVINALELKVKTEAILFGEPTGGNPRSHVYNVDSFILPNSKIEVWYSTIRYDPHKRFGAAVGDENTLVPDFIVPLTVEDVWRDRDPVLEAIIAYPGTK